MRVRVSGGWKIRLESGKLLPKVYPTVKAVQKRLQQLEIFKSIKGKK